MEQGNLQWPQKVVLEAYRPLLAWFGTSAYHGFPSIIPRSPISRSQATAGGENSDLRLPSNAHAQRRGQNDRPPLT
jgi:hypothetical protein